jgi:hypothetical protein
MQSQLVDIRPSGIGYLSRDGKKQGTYVKSPVASLTLDCSSVKKRVRVMISVFIVVASDGGSSPFSLVAMA